MTKRIEAMTGARFSNNKSHPDGCSTFISKESSCFEVIPYADKVSVRVELSSN